MKTLNDEGAGAPLARKVDYHIRRLPKSELRKNSRRKAFERAEKSPSLAITYPRLKTLTVDLLYFDREIVSWGHGLRYRANLETAKSMLHFICPSGLCHGGGFNVSEVLRAAVREHRKTVDGQVHCHGSRDQATGKTDRCESVLHFKMNLTFNTKAVARRSMAAREQSGRIGFSRKGSSPIRSRYCE
jgi:hypothetical protein